MRGDVIGPEGETNPGASAPVAHRWMYMTGKQAVEMFHKPIGAWIDIAGN